MLTGRCSMLAGALLALAPHAAWSVPVEVVVAPPADRFPIRQFGIDGNTFLSVEKLLAALQPFLGDAKTAQDLAHARETVQRLYREAGYEMVSVMLGSPPGADGSIRLRVHETRIGKITVSGNEHFSTDGLRASLPALKAQESPNFKQLARQLFLANDNPSRQVALAFSPGDAGTADVAVKVADERPLKMAVSVDNTGTHETGRGRATLLATHANLWDAGHEAAASYTTSTEEPGQVSQYGLSYLVPLPSLGDRLQLSYTYSNSDIGRVADAFNVSGQGSTAGLRYQHFLRRTATSRYLIDLGIEDKRYKNTIDWLDTNVGVDVNARPASLGYQYADKGPDGSMFASLGFARNLSGGARNDDATYDASRSGAKAGWNAWRTYLDLRLGGAAQWNLHSVFEAQYSNYALISGEQFGLGGARSVRGFAERDTSGDRGWRLSNEVISPLLDGQHRLLGFIDGGRQSRVKVLPGESKGEGLMSYGVGWRWSHGGTMIAALDWARVVNGTAGTSTGHQAVHFSAVWRFI